MKKFIIFIGLICFAFNAKADKYPVISGFHIVGPDCYFFHVTIYEDHDNGDPTDDTKIGSGWVASDGCNPGGSQHLTSPGGDTDFLNSFDLNYESDGIRNIYQSSSTPIIYESTEVEVQIFPNPAYETIQFEVEDFNVRNGFVFSVATGQVVKELPFETDISLRTVNVSDLAKGEYILWLSDDHQITKSKFVIAD